MMKTMLKIYMIGESDNDDEESSNMMKVKMISKKKLRKLKRNNQWTSVIHGDGGIVDVDSDEEEKKRKEGEAKTLRMLVICKDIAISCLIYNDSTIYNEKMIQGHFEKKVEVILKKAINCMSSAGNESAVYSELAIYANPESKVDLLKVPKRKQGGPRYDSCMYAQPIHQPNTIRVPVMIEWKAFQEPKADLKYAEEDMKKRAALFNENREGKHHIGVDLERAFLLTYGETPENTGGAGTVIGRRFIREYRYERIQPGASKVSENPVAVDIGPSSFGGDEEDQHLPQGQEDFWTMVINPSPCKVHTHVTNRQRLWEKIFLAKSDFDGNTEKIAYFVDAILGCLWDETKVSILEGLCEANESDKIKNGLGDLLIKINSAVQANRNISSSFSTNETKWKNWPKEFSEKVKESWDQHLLIQKIKNKHGNIGGDDAMIVDDDEVLIKKRGAAESQPMSQYDYDERYDDEEQQNMREKQIKILPETVTSESGDTVVMKIPIFDSDKDVFIEQYICGLPISNPPRGGDEHPVIAGRGEDGLGRTWDDDYNHWKTGDAIIGKTFFVGGNWYAQMRPRNDREDLCQIFSDAEGGGLRLWPNIVMSKLMWAALVYPEGNKWQVMIDDFRSQVVQGSVVLSVDNNDDGSLVDFVWNLPDEAIPLSMNDKNNGGPEVLNPFEIISSKKKRTTKAWMSAKGRRTREEQNQKRQTCPAYLIGAQLVRGEAHTTGYGWRFLGGKPPKKGWDESLILKEKDGEIYEDHMEEESSASSSNKRRARLPKNQEDMEEHGMKSRCELAENNLKEFKEKLKQSENNLKEVEDKLKQSEKKLEENNTEKKEFLQKVRDGLKEVEEVKKGRISLQDRLVNSEKSRKDLEKSLANSEKSKKELEALLEESKASLLDSEKSKKELEALLKESKKKSEEKDQELKKNEGLLEASKSSKELYIATQRRKINELEAKNKKLMEDAGLNKDPDIFTPENEESLKDWLKTELVVASNKNEDDRIRELKMVDEDRINLNKAWKALRIEISKPLESRKEGYMRFVSKNPEDEDIIFPDVKLQGSDVYYRINDMLDATDKYEKTLNDLFDESSRRLKSFSDNCDFQEAQGPPSSSSSNSEGEDSDMMMEEDSGMMMEEDKKENSSKDLPKKDDEESSPEIGFRRY
jgi:hypothetical protein